MANPTAQSRSWSISRDSLAFTRDAIRTRIFDAQFDHSPTLAMFFGRLQNASFGGVPLNGGFKDVTTGGESVTHRVNLGGSSNTKRLSGPFDSVNIGVNDTVRNGYANWKHYSDTIVLSDFEMLINRGDNAISSILEHETANCIRSIGDAIGDDLYATTTGGVTALPVLIAANNTADNLSGAATGYTKWNSRGVSPRGTADTDPSTVSFASGSFAAQGMADMRTAWLGASEGAITPRVITTTYLAYSYYEGSLQPQERFTNTSVADGGFTQLAFHNAPVFPDAKVASGEMYFLNPEYIRAHVLAGADFDMKDFVEVTEQEAMVSKCLVKAQTVVLDRRLNNKLTSIAA